MSKTRWRADFASQTRITPGRDALDEDQLLITVLFTTRDGTLTALKHAAEMAHGLGAAIRILVPQIVPYPLQLRFPPIDFGFTNRRLQTMFHDCPVKTHLEVFLCRDLADCLTQGLSRNAMVLIGGRKRWWPTKESKLATELAKKGHQALLVTF